MDQYYEELKKHIEREMSKEYQEYYSKLASVEPGQLLFHPDTPQEDIEKLRNEALVRINTLPNPYAVTIIALSFLSALIYLTLQII